MKVYRKVVVELHSFLTLALDACEQAKNSLLLNEQKAWWATGPHWMFGEQKIFCPCLD
jgi:hypothetical protein